MWIGERGLVSFMYFGKLNDGRLLLNQFDTDGGQHYPWTLVRSCARGLQTNGTKQR